MLKLGNLALISMLLLLVSSCGSSEEKVAPTLPQGASINDGVKQVKEQITQKQVMTAEQDTAEQTEVETKQTSATTAKVEPAYNIELNAQPTPERTSIHTIAMQNKYGQVAFNHAAHTQFISCGTCHPTEPPTRIDKNRKEYHTLCRTCHHESGAGPVKCSGCHEH